MSDTPLPPEPAPDQPVAPEHEVEVDLAAFLPEGSSFAGPEGAGDGAVDAWPAEDDDAWPSTSADLTEDGDVDALTAVDGAPGTEAGTVEPEPEPEPAPREPPVDLAALGQIEADLGAVDAALLALDQGRYGTCTACDQPIDDELLAADPTRTTCAAHAPA